MHVAARVHWIGQRCLIAMYSSRAILERSTYTVQCTDLNGCIVHLYINYHGLLKLILIIMLYARHAGKLHE